MWYEIVKLDDRLGFSELSVYTDTYGQRFKSVHIYLQQKRWAQF